MNVKKQVMFIVLIFLTFIAGNATECNIVDFGAVDGKLSTSSIQKAVDNCHEKGGGRVVVPTGTFITGTILLKSNVNLYLEHGAVLLGSNNMEDYKILGTKHGMIFCEDAINVGISGFGTINGNGTNFYDTTANHVYDEFDKSLTRQKENYMPEGTFFTDGPIKRIAMPGMTVVFFHCTNVSLTGITILDTPIWATRFGFCDGVRINGVTITNNVLVPNSDGIHCTASRNIHISNCNIVAGDDAIVLTGFPKDEETPGFSSAEQDKYQHGNKTSYGENMVVTNCILKSSSAAIRIGYGQHPIRRCVFSNIVIHDSNRGIGIFAHDGSNIEELIFSDIIIETRLFNGQWWGNGEPIHLSCISRFPGYAAGQIRNVRFNNIIATGEHGILVFGIEESQIENIQFNNVRLQIKKGKETIAYGGNFDLRPAANRTMQIFEHDIPGLYAQYVKNLSISNFEIEWASQLPDFFTHAIEINYFESVFIDRFKGSPALENKAMPVIKVGHGEGLQITNSISTGESPLTDKTNVR